MPKIVRFYENGGPEKLKIEQAPSQNPGPGEVRIKVQAAGLNRAELMYLSGHYLESSKLPSRIGYEVSGVVDAAGPDVDRAWVGKAVSTIPGFSMNRYGAISEEAIVPLSAAAEWPEGLSPVEAAAIWMQYMTAYGALVAIGMLRPGDVVILPAASSSVGLAAIEIVKDAGATSIATTRRSKKKQELLDLGADHVIATEEEDLPQRVS